MGAHSMPKNEKWLFLGRKRPPIEKLHKVACLNNAL